MSKKPGVVLDTNVVISGAVAKIESSPRKTLQLLKQRQFALIFCLQLLTELQRVLEYSRIKDYFGLSPEKIKKIITFVVYWAKMEKVTKIEPVIKDDPDDNVVLACGLSAKADYIVTGDKHLLKLRHYRKIKIVPPEKFVRLFA